MIRKSLAATVISTGLTVGLLANPAAADHECGAPRDTPPAKSACKEAGHHDERAAIDSAMAVIVAAAAVMASAIAAVR